MFLSVILFGYNQKQLNSKKKKKKKLQVVYIVLSVISTC